MACACVPCVLAAAVGAVVWLSVIAADVPPPTDAEVVSDELTAVKDESIEAVKPVLSAEL